MLTSAPSGSAQAVPVLETPQEVNERLRTLASSAHGLPHDYVIGSGDLVDIEVFDVKELSREVRVSQTGSVGIPLVPVRLHLAGLTEVQAQQKIAEVLEVNGLVTHADVSVTVKERKSKPITVVGAVMHPMVYQAEQQVTLLEVLAEAGGVSSDAADTVIVVRPAQEGQEDSSDPPLIGPEAPVSPSTAGSSATGSKQEPTPAAPSANGTSSNTITINLAELMETGNTKNNILLQAGDIVTVPHSGIVYALGAVNRSGGFVLSNDRAQMSTLKLLSLAGGLTKTAKSDHAVIVRKDSQGKQHEVAVDLKRVLKREAEDVQLQPSDILYIPESGAKQAMYRTLELGLALGSGVALYRLAYH